MSQKTSSVESQAVFAMKPVRIFVMGPPGVGKTSIIKSLKRASKKRPSVKAHSRVYIPTEEPYYPQLVKLGGNDMEVMDTTWSSDFPLMRKVFIRTGDAFVLVFSVEDMSSFEQIAAIREEIRDIHGDTVPVIVLGNKSDTEMRQVPMELADCIVSIDWEHTYNEVSANNRKSISRVFKDLVKCNALQTKLQNMHRRRRHSFPRVVFLRQLFRTKSDRREATTNPPMY